MTAQNLSQIEDLRNQFYDCLVDAGFVPSQKEVMSSRARVRFLKVPAQLNQRAEDPKMVMSCLAAGMYPKLLMTDASGVFRTLTHNAPTSIHPSSINFNYGKKPDFGDSRFAVYCNVIQTKKLCAWLFSDSSSSFPFTKLTAVYPPFSHRRLGDRTCR